MNSTETSKNIQPSTLRRKRRIMIIVGSFKIGGAERMSINVGEELTRRGYDVHYVLQRNIIQLKHSFPPSHLHILNPEQTNKFLLHARNFAGVLAMRLKLRPDMVMAFTYYSSFLACFTLSRKIIARFDMNPFRLKRKARHRVSDFVGYWPFVRKIVIPSFGLGKEISDRNRNFHKKVHVIHNSIDVATIARMSELPSDVPSIDGPYMTGMGRLTALKNFDLLLGAFAKSKISSTTRVVIIGDGAFLPRLRKKAQDLGIVDKVTFAGFSKNPFPVVKNSTLFVNTSSSESFCNVILEALTLGVPVVATDCDFGPAEIVANGVNGFLFKTGDEEALVKIFDQLSDHPEVFDQLRPQTIVTAEKFDLKRIGDQWEKLVESL